MKSFLVVVVLVTASVFTWRIVDRLSADALGLAIGVLFGICAGIPAALLMLAAGRRGEYHETGEADNRRRGSQRQGQFEGYGQGYLPQPPVIVLAGNGIPGQMSPPFAHDAPAGDGRRTLPAPPETVDVRQFKVVGEKEEWIDEW